MLKSLYPLIDKNGNSLHVEYDNDLGSMYADKTKVRQVLINLISNATKYAPATEIILSVSRKIISDSEWVSFTITDKGVGIAAEKLDSLFDEFSQLDSIDSSLQKGTGLGLAISQKFCQKMGGNITVESHKNTGSVFTVHIPAQVAKSKVA
jgi:signal transduction histidine kinase